MIAEAAAAGFILGGVAWATLTAPLWLRKEEYQSESSDTETFLVEVFRPMSGQVHEIGPGRREARLVFVDFVYGKRFLDETVKICRKAFPDGYIRITKGQ